MLLKSAAVTLGYAAIARGLRLPKRLSELQQWGGLMDLIERQNINVFLDVGANRGYFSKHLRMAGYKGRLISFEPNPSDLSHFPKTDDEWHICDYALGANSGIRNFNANLCNGESTLSSFLPFVGEMGESNTIAVNVQRLDEVLPSLISSIAEPGFF